MIVALVLGASGCGPFGYLTKVARDATRAVADAEKAGAEQYAPYEYWGAVSYLEQAKVMMAYSEYERSFDYGTRAKQLAEEAKKKAERRESGTMKESTEPATTGGKPVPIATPPKPNGDAAGNTSGTAGDGKATGTASGSVGGGQ